MRYIYFFSSSLRAEINYPSLPENLLRAVTYRNQKALFLFSRLSGNENIYRQQFLIFTSTRKKYIAINKYLRSITDLEDLGALYILWLKLNSVSFLQKVLIRIIFNRQNGNEKLFIMSLPTDQNNIFIWFSL